MSEIGFAVLCSAGGIVTHSYGESDVRVGAPLVLEVAKDSRERLLQMLQDAQTSEQHSVLQMAEDVTVEIHCASQDGQTLVIAGSNPSDVRRRCEELHDDPVAGPLARRISETAAPDELTLDLWSELARVNNELATTQRQLAKKNAELRWLNEQKNLLMGMAAHDLRNPLAAMIGYATFVLEDVKELSAEHASMVRRIKFGADTMLRMVEDVLDFSAIESGTVRLEISEFSLGALLTEVAETNGLIAERKKIHIETRVEDGVTTLHADRRKLMQVLNNLVTNAVKFSHPDATITISAKPGDNGDVCIRVEDQGVGMSAAQIARLFEPFARVGVEATAGERGTGLGLAIVRRIVGAHRGRVEVESTPGQGTAFTVVLPTS